MWKKKIRITLNQEDIIPSANELFNIHNYIVLNKAQKLAEKYIRLISNRVKYRSEHGVLWESFSRHSEKEGEEIFRFFSFCDSGYTSEIIKLCEQFVFAYFKELGYLIEWRDSSVCRNEKVIYISWDKSQ
jgi:hypothetical protein